MLVTVLPTICIDLALLAKNDATSIPKNKTNLIII